MSLSALPAELKLDIAEYLDPDTTLSLALTCKENATHCKPVLKVHHQKLSERQVINNSHGETVLWKILKEVLHDPSVGWYVRELNLPPPRYDTWMGGDDGDEVDDSQYDEEKALFNHAARQLQYLYPVEERYISGGVEYPFEIEAGLMPSDLIGSIQNRINKGHEDGIIAILLHYLPFLDTIRLTALNLHCLELSLMHIADQYKASTHSVHLPLQHLKTASVAHDDTEMSCHADWACFFTGIPSLKTFAAQNMGDEPRLKAPYQDRLSANYVPTSNVTELFFIDCQFDVKGLAAILVGIKNLKKFTYVGGGATVSESSSYEPKRVIEALVKHVGNSLEELVLYQDEAMVDLSDEQDVPSVSLRDFQKLKLLECGWDIIRPLDNDNDDDDDTDLLEEGFHTAEDKPDISPFDLRTILPASLEKLYIRGEVGDDLKDYWLEVFKTPSAFTPNLRSEDTCIYGFVDDTGVFVGEGNPPLPIWELSHCRLFDDHGPW